MATYRSPAIKRYMLRLIVLMAINLVTLFIAVRAFHADAVSGAAAYALAIAPALPIIGVFWAVMRLLSRSPTSSSACSMCASACSPPASA